MEGQWKRYLIVDALVAWILMDYTRDQLYTAVAGFRQQWRLCDLQTSARCLLSLNIQVTQELLVIVPNTAPALFTGGKHSVWQHYHLVKDATLYNPKELCMKHFSTLNFLITLHPCDISCDLRKLLIMRHGSKVARNRSTYARVNVALPATTAWQTPVHARKLLPASTHSLFLYQ